MLGAGRIEVTASFVSLLFRLDSPLLLVLLMPDSPLFSASMFAGDVVVVAMLIALIDISLIDEEILIPNAAAARWKRFGVWLVLATSIFGGSTLD